MACSAERPVLPESSRSSGASCAAGPRMRSAPCFSRWESTFALSAAWLGGQGSISREVVPLFAVALPVVIAGTWLGLKFYGTLDEAQFRKIVLVLLLASGAVLFFR